MYTNIPASRRDQLRISFDNNPLLESEYGVLPSPKSQFTSQRHFASKRTCVIPPKNVATYASCTSDDCSDESILDKDRVNASDVVSLANLEESKRLLRQKRANISSAVQAMQRTSTSKFILGEERHPLDNERKYLDLKFRDRPCIRSESFLNEELWRSINDLSRECCDVLGPRHCHDCAKLKKRSDSVTKSVESFPMNITGIQLATMSVVRRMHPELSPSEVLQRIERGDISTQPLKRDRLNDRIREFSKCVLDGEAATLRRRSRSISAFNVSDGQGFFANIADLRKQINCQQFGRRGRRNAIFELPKESMVLPPPIQDVQLVQVNEVGRENPANCFSLPLLSRDDMKYPHNQPRFYAGKPNEKYKLPTTADLDTLLIKSADAARRFKYDLAAYKRV